MKRFPIILSIILPFALLAGPMARAQAPVLTALSPVRNALAAAWTSPVALTFSQPMSAAAASGAAIKVISSRRGGLLTRPGGGGTFGGAGTNTVSFQPAQPFLPGEVLTVVATPAATSAAGAALAAAQVYQFTTKAGAGPGTFITDSMVRVGGSPANVAVADVDGDGDLDLLAPTYGSGTVSVRRNDGTGHFAPGTGGAADEVPVSGQPFWAEAADVDGDGDLDLLAANYGTQGQGDYVSVRVNDGTGLFSGTQEVLVNPGVYTLTMADVDGDGDLDLIAASGLSPLAVASHVAIRLNDGAGQFGSGFDLPTLDAVNKATAGDIDGDGDVDLLTPYVGLSMAGVGVWRNTGAGAFVAGPALPLASPLKGTLADLDNDGDLDLLHVQGILQIALSSYLNDGTGAFTLADTMQVAGQTNDLVAADFDGDGDLDVVTANVYASTLSAFVNDGTGHFGPVTTYASGRNPFSLAAADVDGDGDLDLLTADFGDSGIGVLLNGGTAVGLAPAVGAEAEAVSLFPNPARHTVRLTNAPAGPVTVLDAVGRTVRTATINVGQTEATLSVEGLPPGLYVVRAGQQTRRLVVE